MRDQIIEYLAKNQLRLQTEVIELGRNFAEQLANNEKDFHDLIKEQYRHKLKGHVINDLSRNFDVNGQKVGIDYETSMSELDDVDIVDVLGLTKQMQKQLEKASK